MHRESFSNAWAKLRLAVIGPLLGAPPEPGQLHVAIEALAQRDWRHPVSGETARFAAATIERWYYKAHAARDPIAALRRTPRCDHGLQRTLSAPLKDKILQQHREHSSWSIQLHYDNLRVLVRAEPALGPLPSYTTVRRFMRSKGLRKTRRRGANTTVAMQAADARLEAREVRSYEAEQVGALWHCDFHRSTVIKVVTAQGQWIYPQLAGVLDDHSRLACHVQWYLDETAETLCHAFLQAFLKYGLPRSLLSDNGSAMIAEETTEGLARLSIVHQTTLPHSPYQNGKQESFWGNVEGRLMAMLESVPALTLQFLNTATQAWVDLDYNRKEHSEIRAKPIDRFLNHPNVLRPAPQPEILRLAFRLQAPRTQRHSDGTVSIEGRRFEIPSAYRHLSKLTVRYARWDLGTVHLIDARADQLLCQIFPSDKNKNADGQRRALHPTPVDTPAKPGELPPLLRQMLADYAATGLPPAYLPRHESE